MDERELLAAAAERIEKHRKADARIRVQDKAGKPAAGVELSVEQVRHAFLFGSNNFGLFRLTEQEHPVYDDRFSSLLNYATLPFYWGHYEPEPGKTEARHRENLAIARWCAERDIKTKGHPLVWHEVFPQWGPQDPAEARRMSQARIRRIISDFRGSIGLWDVINEATVAHRYNNGNAGWIGADPLTAAGECLEWAHQADPQAVLVYNDFNISPEFEALAEGLVRQKRPVHVIGVQSHMHVGEWPLEKVWNACEAYGRHGLPVHFTELTVLSGKYKDKDDKDWHQVRSDWVSTPEGEARQADYVEKIYTLLFSHPAVQAVTWWDLRDGGWQGAPAGLIRKDLSPKPAYERLMGLIKGRWWTRTTVRTGADGTASIRGFLGQYRIRVKAAGQEQDLVMPLKTGKNDWNIGV